MELEKEVWCPTCKTLIKQVDTFTAKGGHWQKGYVYHCSACGAYLPELRNKRPLYLQSREETERLREKETAARARKFASEHSVEELAPQFAEALVNLARHVVQDIYRCPACSRSCHPYEEKQGEWQRMPWSRALEIALEPGWPAAGCQNCQTLWLWKQKPVQATSFE